MKIVVFSSHEYEKEYFNEINKKFGHTIQFLDIHLTPQTAIIAKEFDCVCAFVNDILNKETLTILKEIGIKIIALRSAGFNHVDLKAAHSNNIPVVRVPAYSPHAIAEHAMALLLTLNRKIHKAYNRTRDFNFSLDGLVGFDLYQKTVGIIGTGKIGIIFAKILAGFGCKVLAYDKYPDDEYKNICVIGRNIKVISSGQLWNE